VRGLLAPRLGGAVLARSVTGVALAILLAACGRTSSHPPPATTSAPPPTTTTQSPPHTASYPRTTGHTSTAGASNVRLPATFTIGPPAALAANDGAAVRICEPDRHRSPRTPPPTPPPVRPRPSREPWHRTSHMRSRSPSFGPSGRPAVDPAPNRSATQAQRPGRAP